MTIPKRELEDSPLSGLVTRDGFTVEVLIYCCRDTSNSWSLEVVDQEGDSPVWMESFLTDQLAYKAFLRAVEAGGMSEFIESGEEPGETLH